MNYPSKTRVHFASSSSDQVLGIKENRQKGSCYKGFSVIKKGGMGTILKVKDTNCGREVAMKICTANEDGLDGLERLLHEARITANLEHPNIIPIHEINCDSNDDVYYTMKFVKGDNLEKVLDSLRSNDPAYLAKYPLSELLNIFMRICDGISFAHSKGVIHRDLKPENIMIGDYGEVLIMDWGIAKILTNIDEESAFNDTEFIAKNIYPDKDQTKTQSGAVFGTPAFMAPEQIQGKNHAVDQRTDIYALGGILYSILTLRQPIIEDDIQQLFAKVIAGEITPPFLLENSKNKQLKHLTNGYVPASLSAIAMKALATSPEMRYQTVNSIQKDLRAYQDGFATEAEHASNWRKLSLLVNRNAIFIVLIFFIVTTTAYNIYKEKIIANESQTLQNIYQNNLNEIQRGTETKIDRKSLQENSQQLLSLIEKKIAAKEFSEAKTIVLYLENLIPENHKIPFFMGQIFEHEENLTAAEASYKRALRRAPNDQQVLLALQKCQQKIAAKN